MYTGIVKWFNDCKGYGFILNGSDEDIFVHYSSIVGQGYRTLRQGDKVVYEMKEGAKGLQATRVVRES